LQKSEDTIEIEYNFVNEKIGDRNSQMNFQFMEENKPECGRSNENSQKIQKIE
jgi:hypothetical protein